MKLLYFFFLLNILTTVYSTKAPILNLTPNDANFQWTAYKVNHRRDHNKTEDSKRRSIFLNNLNKINELNKKYNDGNLKYVSGINKFSDWVNILRNIYIYIYI
jgi:hypothetical protein